MALTGPNRTTLKITGKMAALVVDGNGDAISHQCLGCPGFTITIYVQDTNSVRKYYNGPNGHRYDSKSAVVSEFSNKLGTSSDRSFDLGTPPCKPCNWYEPIVLLQY